MSYLINERLVTSIRQGHGRAPGDRLLVAMLVVLLVGAPTVFLRTTMRPFYIPKLTFFWVAVSVVVLVGVYRVLALHRHAHRLDR